MNSLTGKSQKLAPSLMRKLSQRGVYDTEIALVKADARAKKAGDNLRSLIERTYTDAEQVKEQIRQMLDLTGILEMDAIVGLNAEASFYDCIAARIERKQAVTEKGATQCITN